MNDNVLYLSLCELFGITFCALFGMMASLSAIYDLASFQEWAKNREARKNR
jgi:hypothetical protein